MSRRWVIAALAVALVALACDGADGIGDRDEPPAAPVRGMPSSMIALGDSISAGYGTCLAPTACPRNSWSTGDGPQVLSHYRRILAANPAIRHHARNLSRPGSTVGDLADQAAAASRQKADYVTVLIGGNDACRGSMTSVAEFRDDVDRALATLKRAMPSARLLVVGIPDIYRVWEIGHANRFVVSVWEAGSCPTLLANPTSTARADVARRKAFRDRVAAYNGQLRAACTAYGHRCRYDDSAYRVRFDLTMLSAVDFFHPNAEGQEVLARETYPGTFTW